MTGIDHAETQQRALRAGIDACVHCGFCLPACPTYLALEDENDSPRGRIVLMNALLEGKVDASDPAVTKHLDQCLGCRGCETACPSGVPYGRLLEGTRERLAEVRPLPWVARAVLAIFAREWALRPALWLARIVRGLRLSQLAMRVLPTRLAQPFAMLEATRRYGGSQFDWRRTAGAPAALLTGCVMEGLLAPVNRATESVIAFSGHRVVDVPEQVCCGALHAHAGDTDAARDLAKRNIAAFEAADVDAVVTNSAGCGAMCRDYAHLLEHDPEWAARAAAFSKRVRDVHELVRPVDYVLDGESTITPYRVAWDAPCHLEHAQRLSGPAVDALRLIAPAQLVALAGSDQCCGSAGIFSLLEPDVAQRVLAPKLRAIEASGAQVLATANPGCLMQIGAGLLLEGSQVTTRHPVELLVQWLLAPRIGASTLPPPPTRPRHADTH